MHDKTVSILLHTYTQIRKPRYTFTSHTPCVNTCHIPTIHIKKKVIIYKYIYMSIEKEC